MMNVENKNSDFSVPAVNQQIFLVDASAGPITVTFLHSLNATFTTIIKKTDSSTNKVTLTTPLGELFDGDVTLSLSKRYESLQILHANNRFHILAHFEKG